MNDKNLRNINLTHEEATKNGKKGGLASGTARRQKKQMKDMLEYILQLKVTDGDLRAEMRNMGIADEQMTINALTCYAMIRKAVEGDTKAAEFIATMTGQKPQDKVNVNATVENKVAMPKWMQSASLADLQKLGIVGSVPLADTSEYDTEILN